MPGSPLGSRDNGMDYQKIGNRRIAANTGVTWPGANITTYAWLFSNLGSFFLMAFFYSCSSTVVSIFTHHSPSPSHPHLPPSILPFVHVSFILVPWWSLPFFPPVIPSALPSGCCQFVLLFQCLWLYFACLFILLIRFHWQVRSYGICLPLPGLFHLA